MGTKRLKTQRRIQLERIAKVMADEQISVPVLEELMVLWGMLDLLDVWRKAAFEESGEAVAAMELCKAMDTYYKDVEDVEEDNGR